MSALPGFPGPSRIRLLDPELAQLRLARDPLGRMSELFSRWGAPVALLRGGGGRVFSADPSCPGVVFVCGRDLSRQVELDHDRLHRASLVGQLAPKGEVGSRYRPLLEWGTGLFAANGDEHRRQRRLISQFLTRSRVEGYFGEFVRSTELQLRDWSAGRLVDIHQQMMDLTVRISARALLGLDIEGNQEIVRAGAESLRLVLSPWVLLAPLDLPGLPYRRFVNAVSGFNQRLRESIEDRRRGARMPDVLSALIDARDEAGGLSEAEVVGHASVIYAASHETTGNALTWTLFLLSQHPAWHRTVVEEARTLLPRDELAVQDLEKLEALDKVVHESLRLLPSAPWTTRVAAAETTIGDHAVPVGTEVVVSIYHTNREQRYYDRPDVFDPERWSRVDPDVFQFNAFSAGPRACVGRAFAMLEMKVILAMILRRTRLELAPRRRIDPVLNITMAPRRGLWMVPRADSRFDEGVGGVRGGIRRLVRLE